MISVLEKFPVVMSVVVSIHIVIKKTINRTGEFVSLYKASFNKNDTEARKAFQMAVQRHYGSDLWGPCDTAFILFETSDEPAKVMEKIDVSTGSETSSLAGAGELNLQLGAAREDDPTLPDDAKMWLVEQIKTRASVEKLTKIPRFPGSRELMNWDDLLI
jgi:hypothetical protein